MARTPSTMLPLGTVAPAFRLPDTNGNLVSLDDAKKAPGFLVIFLCNHCPFVIHVRHEIARLAAEYRAKGIAVFGINSNDAEKYADDSPERMREEAARVAYTFPYLFDETQEVAKAYRAACTPDFFLFDRDRRLVYRGQMDGARPGNDVAVTGKDLRAALDAVLRGDPVSEEQLPSLGCNIKWKPGNEPDYFR
ncbi:MAG: thioredoxin family protein [Candidatus Eisenbacteria bacterium]|nr:thioredoxin family protein [Candidatus Eisenbacteria bacterium]